MRTTVILAVIAAITTSMVVSCATAPEAKKPPVAQAHNPSAESLLKRMARVYGSARSYTDSGEAYDYHNGIRDSASIHFRIHYVRPDRLRFEMTQNVGSPYQPERYTVIWSDGNWTYSWQQSYADVSPKGDLTWKPEPFVFEKGASVRYIDFEAGDDAKDGLTKETAWKHHPWDPNAGGIFFFPCE